MEGCCTENCVLPMSCGFRIEGEGSRGGSLVHGDARDPAGLGWTGGVPASSFGSGVEDCQLCGWWEPSAGTGSTRQDGRSDVGRLSDIVAARRGQAVKMSGVDSEINGRAQALFLSRLPCRRHFLIRRMDEAQVRLADLAYHLFGTTQLVQKFHSPSDERLGSQDRSRSDHWLVQARVLSNLRLWKGGCRIRGAHGTY